MKRKGMQPYNGKTTMRHAHAHGIAHDTPKQGKWPMAAMKNGKMEKRT